MSHPLRVRGLKLDADKVAEYNRKSHPLRVRGLKLPTERHYYLRVKSHPLRVRGLKRVYDTLNIPVKVAPSAGAWIETLKKLSNE